MTSNSSKKAKNARPDSKPHQRSKNVKNAVSKDTVAKLNKKEDVNNHKILQDAVNYIVNSNIDKLVVTDFITKIAYETYAGDAQINNMVINVSENNDVCYRSHPGSNEVTIWQGSEIVGHMQKKDARDKGIPACSRT